MSIYSDVTEQDLINLRKVAEQQKNICTNKSKKRILKQTHDIILPEKFSPFTKKLDVFSESTTKLQGFVQKSNVEDENTQTPAIENITGTQSLRDTSTFMGRSKKISKVEEKSNGDVFWSGVSIPPLGKNRIRLKMEYMIQFLIFIFFSNTKLTTKSLNNNEKETVFEIHDNVGFYYMKNTRRIN